MSKSEYYINRRKNSHCIDIPSSLSDYLKSDNYLSEFYSDEDKQQVRDNLGITEQIEELRNTINAGRVLEGDVGWDTVPTEGNTSNVLSSDALFRVFQEYAKQDDINTLNSNLRQYISDLISNYYTKEQITQLIINSLNNFYNTTVSKYDERIFELQNEIGKLEDKLNDYETLDIKQSFGQGKNTTISQKFLTDSYNFLFDLINEISPRERVTISISPTSFAMGESADVNIVVNGNGLNLETIKIYFNGEETISVEEENYYETTVPINTNTTIRVEATLLGFTYEKEQQIIEKNAFYLGSGANWQDVRVIANAVKINGTSMVGSYDMEVTNTGDRIFIIVPKGITFNRACMSSVEIPFIQEYTDDYDIFVSINTYTAGEYNIDIE